ncbi:MAG: hypothetical protein U5N10_13100 [Gemmobacter sp.]|nr:hypothetical protein [Gemmobacter sp.]
MAYLFIGLILGLVLLVVGVGYLLHTSKAPKFDPEMAEKFEALKAEKNTPRKKGGKAGAGKTVRLVNAAPAAAAGPSRIDAKLELLGRDELKSRCLALLDAAAMEHPAGHGKLFARYVLRTQDDDRIEMMFEKGEKSRANLWLTCDHAVPLVAMGVEFRDYPASALYQPTEPGGKPVYGRHSALKSMRDLANADLVRFTIDRVDQMEMILTRLKTADQVA